MREFTGRSAPGFSTALPAVSHQSPRPILGQGTALAERLAATAASWWASVWEIEGVESVGEMPEEDRAAALRMLLSPRPLTGPGASVASDLEAALRAPSRSQRWAFERALTAAVSRRLLSGALCEISMGYRPNAPLCEAVAISAPQRPGPSRFPFHTRMLVDHRSVRLALGRNSRLCELRLRD